jgi:putative spermidine/putrescine transport system ATP-binding protein
MDEPLGALDKKLRDQMQLEIKHLHTQLGITVLYVTHDQEEAMIMSDRICLMNEGRIEQIGTPAELYFQPRSVFAADFLGESNILEAAVAGAEGEATVLTGVAGATIRAPAHAGVKTGDRVRFMVRPERLRVLGKDASADNVLAGTLRDVILVGGVTRYYVTLAVGRTVSATRLTAGPVGAETPGSAVRLGWATASSVLLPDGPPGTRA